MSAGTSEFFCLICFLVCSCTAQAKISADLGHNVTLPCEVPNNDDITAVEWRRPDQDPEYVLYYRDGQFDPDNQHQSYKNRVDLQDKEMKDGKVSLVLTDLMKNDTGTYECLVFQGGNNEPISIINLVVLEPGNKDRNSRGHCVVVTEALLLLAVLASVEFFNQ